MDSRSFKFADFELSGWNCSCTGLGDLRGCWVFCVFFNGAANLYLRSCAFRCKCPYVKWVYKLRWKREWSSKKGYTLNGVQPATVSLVLMTQPTLLFLSKLKVAYVLNCKESIIMLQVGFSLNRTIKSIRKMVESPKEILKWTKTSKEGLFLIITNREYFGYSAISKSFRDENVLWLLGKCIKFTVCLIRTSVLLT